MAGRLLLILVVGTAFAKAASAQSPTALYPVVIGDRNAPFSLHYFSSFDCRYCQRFEERTVRALNGLIQRGELNVVVLDVMPEAWDGLVPTQALHCAGRLAAPAQERQRVRAHLSDVGFANAQPGPVIQNDDFDRCMTSVHVIGLLSLHRAWHRKSRFHATPSFVLRHQGQAIGRRTGLSNLPRWLRRTLEDAR